MRTAPAAVAFLVSGAALVLQPSPAPTLVIVNARVFTGAPANPWAEALTVVGQRIDTVGTTSALRDAAGAGTRVIDAGGRLVIPGINDAHVHMGRVPPITPLEGPPATEHDPTWDEVLTRVKAAVTRAPPGNWIMGEIGGRVLDHPGATRFPLDEITSDRPVVLTSWTGHGSLFNTAALRALKIREDEPDPPGGFFVRVAGQKTITGRAHEYAEFILRGRMMTLAGAAAQVSALRAYAQRAAAFGITSLQIMAFEPVASAARTAREADVAQRVRIIDFPMSGITGWNKTALEADGDRVTISGTKWILDGTPVERLMFLREPYADRADARGRLNFPASDVEVFLRRALAVREQPLFHAVGDGAIEAVLDALERTGGESWQSLRPRLEHGDMLGPAHFERARRVGLVLVQNPSHFMIPDVMKSRLGDRVGRATMIKSAISAEVPVALGSDGPLNPFLNIMFATMNANNPAEAMTREQALMAYTHGAAYAEFQETRKGTIAPGMLADLAMLSQDIFKVPPEALPKTQSVLTVVDGKVVLEEK